MELIDRWQRRLDYLRVSVIDRCNLRCIYCMPKGSVIDWIPRPEMLTDAEIERLVRVGVGVGIRKVRITGGEPLVRPGIVDLIRKIASLNGIDDLALSTNGLLLDRCAEELRQAGVRRINISLDTVDPQRFYAMTGVDQLGSVLSGIQAAQRAGFPSIKINAVIIRGINDREIEDLADFAEREGLTLRFIEYMPLCASGDGMAGYISCQEILERIRDRLQLDQTVETADRSEPARYFALKSGRGKIGVISPISDAFCSRCNRLRLTADGKLRVCLPSDIEVDLKTPLRSGATDEQLTDLYVLGSRLKPEKGEYEGVGNRSMIQIGG